MSEHRRGEWETIERLASLCGIVPEFIDINGKRRITSGDTRRALLAAMGIDIDSVSKLRDALDERETAEWRQSLPPVLVASENEVPLAIMVTLHASRSEQEYAWTLVSERGEREHGVFISAELSAVAEQRIGGASFVRRRLVLPRSPGPGYHRFELEGGPGMQRAATNLIVAPDKCYQPDAVNRGGRVWGPTVQLYAIKSRRNWGIGDFTDLLRLVEFAAAVRADVVGLNPLHALFPSAPQQASPYSPSSRLFGNVLYIDVEAIAEFAECEAARRAAGDESLQARLRALRAGELVDYEAVAASKLGVLELLYRYFRDQHRGRGDDRDRAYCAFVAGGGEALHRHAIFDALAEEFRASGIASAPDWREWPEAFHLPESRAVTAFASERADRVEFYAYLQWQFEQQLDVAGRHSAELGLGVGLLQDLAVGVAAGGSESWADQSHYATGAHIGAPPDEYNLAGQDWGLPPLIPERLREAAYAPFIATLRRNMRAAGALRIDHVMGLFRLYWVPAGVTPAAGAYVRYPFNDLLHIVCLESWRNRCLIIGEDLGTVPDEVRIGLRGAEVLSSRPLYFQTEEGGAYTAPVRYARDAVVSVGTHDLPTLKGFWLGADLELRQTLGLFPTQEEREQQIVARAAQRAHLLLALEREQLLPAGGSTQAAGAAEMPQQLAIAVQRYVARTPAKLQLVLMEDVFGQVEQINLPGTTTAVPNWRRKLPVDLEDWAEDPGVRALTGAMRAERRPAQRGAPQAEKPMPLAAVIPRATYRMQFNREFTFAHATDLVPYLAALGVSHVYASPYFKARPGSTHGYDIIDHNAINPEIGSREDLERLRAALREHGMGQVLDIVPNHMGVLGADNAWWLDVLENGNASVYANHFDIDWERVHDELQGKLLVPVLGDRYGAVLAKGELSLRFDPSRGEFSLHYATHRFPINPREYPRILALKAERLAARVGADDALALEFQGLVTAFGRLPADSETGAEKVAERNRDKELHKRHLADLYRRSPDIARFIDENVAEINGVAGDDASFDRLHEVIAAQVFRLAYWRVAADDINYRRFFDVNDLAALRIEDPAVFEATHRLLFELVRSGSVDGVRIDHPDGLYDPLQYFKRIQRRATAGSAETGTEVAAGKPMYVVVEKVIAPFERLPDAWPVHGTTGYRFANLVNGLFVDGAAESKLDHGYRAFIGEHPDFDQLVYESKRLITKVTLASELNALASQLSRIAQASRDTCDFTLNSLRSALAEIVACFPVYRTYVTGSRVSARDRRYIDWAVRAAKKRNPAFDVSVFDFLRDAMLTSLAENRSEAERERIVSFAMKLQQFTSAVMAKGMEDTAFYRYNRLLSLNEVGGDPRALGVSVAAFHDANLERAKRWPHEMLATSTHDSKRSEDVRARIDVLSELPAEWRLHVSRWRRANRSRKRSQDDAEMPSLNDEYLLYQTLIGAWPAGDVDAAALGAFRERIEKYVIKVVREAKAASSWVNPNEDYEEAFIGFVRALLTQDPGNRFLADFLPFQRRVAWFGMQNSLSQLLIKLTAPGVPDIYQGSELWDLSLVDPDNRRPVDYRSRRDALVSASAACNQDASELACDLLRHIDDGRIKQFLIWRVLSFRRDHDWLFRDGTYVPLNVIGARAEHVCAYGRAVDGECAIAIAPRLSCGLLGGEMRLPLGEATWADTSIDLSPLPAQRGWRDALTGTTIETGGETAPMLRLASALNTLPVSLLAGEPQR